MRNPLIRLQKKARFEVYEKVVTSYEELLKEGWTAFPGLRRDYGAITLGGNAITVGGV